MSLNIPDAKKAVVIYHFPCMDGFASAWAFSELKEKDYHGPDGVTYVPMNYGKELSEVGILVGDLLNKDVYILDFSFARETLYNIAAISNKLILLDHHKTAQADLENWEDKPANVEIVFDMERSGAKITWDYFSIDNGQVKVLSSPLIEYVSDRDLWKFALSHSKEINAVIANTKYTFQNYRELDAELTNVSFVAGAGKYLMEQHQKFCEEMVENARELIITSPTGEEYKGLAVNTTYQFASEVGNILAKKSGTYGATYFSDSKGAVKFSLRSIGDYDVSIIAKQCGGGGHKNASGFILYPNETDRSDTIKIWAFSAPEGNKGVMR